MIYYYLLVILISNLVVPTEDEFQIAADIREGQINALLTKPMSYLAYTHQHFFEWPSRLQLRYSAANRVDLHLFPGVRVLPTDPLVYVLTVISTVMAAFIQFFITYSLAMFAFWILEISTIVFIVYSFEYFLGGQMFPIDIMPPAVYTRDEMAAVLLRAVFSGRHLSRPIYRGSTCTGVGDSNRLAPAHLDVGAFSCGNAGWATIRPLAVSCQRKVSADSLILRLIASRLSAAGEAQSF